MLNVKLNISEAFIKLNVALTRYLEEDSVLLKVFSPVMCKLMAFLTGCFVEITQHSLLYKDFVFSLINLTPYVRQWADEQYLHAYTINTRTEYLIEYDGLRLQLANHAKPKCVQ